MKSIIQLRDREVNLLCDDDFENLDLKELLTIDYGDLKTSIAEFPFVLNQINFLFIEASDILREEEFKLDCLKSNLEEYRARIYFSVLQALQTEGIKSPTVPMIENRIIMDEGYKGVLESYQIQKQTINKVNTDKERLNGLYWSAKEKMNILTNLSKNIVI